MINTNYTGHRRHLASSRPPNGTIARNDLLPSTGASSDDPFYTSGPSNQPPAHRANRDALRDTAYLPDLTNNPLHGFESFRFPNQAIHAAYPTQRSSPQQIGGTPRRRDLASSPVTDYDSTPSTSRSRFRPTTTQVNANVHSDGLNDADEMNLYSPNPLLDSPFGPGDLEWLYRQQDVDGASLSSRLPQLAPISFTNGLDGARRRRLFALDSWDLNNFVWTNDNPGDASRPTASSRRPMPASERELRFDEPDRHR